jgi:hypothetical protein
MRRRGRVEKSDNFRILKFRKKAPASTVGSTAWNGIASSLQILPDYPLNTLFDRGNMFY